jgi:hypothetical protein
VCGICKIDAWFPSPRIEIRLAVAHGQSVICADFWMILSFQFAPQIVTLVGIIEKIRFDLAEISA